MTLLSSKFQDSVNDLHEDKFAFRTEYWGFDSAVLFQLWEFFKRLRLDDDTVHMEGFYVRLRDSSDYSDATEPFPSFLLLVHSQLANASSH